MTQKQREILLLFSHQVELTSCADVIRTRTYVPFRAERVGIGPSDARQRTAHLLDEASEGVIVLALGSAGWLPKRPQPSGPVWARDVRSEAGRTYRPTLAISNSVLERFGWANARLVTVSRPVLDKERASTLVEELGAEIVDMESRAILQECIDRELECGIIRGITDQARASAAESYRTNIAGAMRTLGMGVADLLNWLHEREERRLAKIARQKTGK